ncbi:MAG: hypothetical protein ACI84K_001484 [Pseudohongiellaceae bacterium]|jgi:hypothetical protein
MKDTLSSVFTFQNRFVMIGWLALVCLPFWAYMPMVVMAIVLVISAVYAYLILFGRRFDDRDRRPHYKDFASLSGVVKMFTNRRVSLAGWLHFLAFDLLVGLFIVLDSQHHDISHFMILPILFLTLMIGPAGLITYFIFRALYTDNFIDLLWLL